MSPAPSQSSSFLLSERVVGVEFQVVLVCPSVQRTPIDLELAIAPRPIPSCRPSILGQYTAVTRRARSASVTGRSALAGIVTKVRSPMVTRSHSAWRRSFPSTQRDRHVCGESKPPTEGGLLLPSGSLLDCCCCTGCCIAEPITGGDEDSFRSSRATLLASAS